MSAEVRQKVVVEVEAKGGANLADPFDKIAKGAKDTDAQLKKMGSGLDQLKSVGKEALGGVQASMMDLGRAAGILDDRIMLLGRGVQGLGASLGFAGIPLASTVTTLGAMAAVVGLVGTAAVVASPALSDKLGGALESITGRAGKAEARVAKLKDRLAGLGSLAETGFRPESVENSLAGDLGPGARYAIEQPFRDKQRELAEREAQSADAAAAAGYFPSNDVVHLDRAKAFERAGLGATEALTGPGGLNQGALTSNLADLRKLATGEQPGNVDAQRAVFMAEQQAHRASGDLTDKSHALERAKEQFEQTQAVTELTAADQAVTKAQQKLKDAEGKTGDYAKLYKPQNKQTPGQINMAAMPAGSDVALVEREKRLHAATVAAAKDQLSEAESNRAMAQEKATAVGLGDDLSHAGTKAQDVMRLANEQAAAAEKNVEAQQRLLAAKQAANKADVESLKTVYQQVDAQAKLFGEIKKQEQAKLQDSKAGFGNMSAEDQQRALELSRIVKGGGSLNQDQLDFARQHSDLFGEAIQKQGLRQADVHPFFNELAQNLGLNNKANAAAKAEEEALKIAADAKNTLEIKLQAGDELAKQLNDTIAPALTDMIKKSLEQMMTAIRQATAKLIEEQITKHEQAKRNEPAQ